MKADVIIGANYGDEGKGLMTDFLANRMRNKVGVGIVAVVRFSGGAQAGHTVVTPDGKRHVFSHFGSGTLEGSPTYLARHFVLNPILYRKELNQLKRLGVDPLLFCDPSCIVTTPYDMLINQAVERSRGSNRHGSVGVGINETVERCEHIGFCLRYEDLWSTDTTSKILDRITKEWVPVRLAALNVRPDLQKQVLAFCDDSAKAQFLAECEFFRKEVCATPPIFLKKTAEHIVFEGAQGLMLDQHFGTFPYVTRANTGLRNVIEIAEAAGVDSLDVTYVTRTYLTRHGAGPMHNEVPAYPYPRAICETNGDHPYQGNLRYGYLDISKVAECVEQDQLYTPIPPHFDVRRYVAMTHLDQIDGEAVWIENGTFFHSPEHELMIDRLIRLTHSSGAYVSTGPTRLDVEPHKD